VRVYGDTAINSGAYTFSPLKIGHYSLSVSAKGFSKTTQKNLTVQVSQILQVNVELKLGAATETVEGAQRLGTMSSDGLGVCDLVGMPVKL
jgi:hypothetical protein